MLGFQRGVAALAPRLGPQPELSLFFQARDVLLLRANAGSCTCCCHSHCSCTAAAPCGSTPLHALLSAPRARTFSTAARAGAGSVSPPGPRSAAQGAAQHPPADVAPSAAHAASPLAVPAIGEAHGTFASSGLAGGAEAGGPQGFAGPGDYHDEQGWDGGEGEGEGEGEAESEEQRQRRRRQRREVSRVLRSSNAAEMAAVHFFRGQACSLRPGAPPRPDAVLWAEQEEAEAGRLRELLPRHRVRPSLVQGPLALAGLALGVAAAAAPPRLRLAVAGAVGDALTEHYNEQLRRINEAGAAQENPELRQALRRLRDVPRCPDGAPPAPDLVSVVQGAMGQQGGGGAGPAAGEGQGGRATGGAGALAGVAGALRRLGVEGTVGAVVKAGARVAIEAASRV